MPSMSEAARGIKPLHLHLGLSTSLRLLTAHPSSTSLPSPLDQKIVAKCRLIYVSLDTIRKARMTHQDLQLFFRHTSFCEFGTFAMLHRPPCSLAQQPRHNPAARDKTSSLNPGSRA